MIQGAKWLTLLLFSALVMGCTTQVDSEVSIMQWPDLLERPRPSADARLDYGEGALQFVDIWVPEGEGPHPAVVMIHGGCWQTDIAERDIMNYIAADLRGRGIGVWNIEYRGVDREGGGYPGTYLDVGRAADLFREKGGDYGLKTDRVVAIGHSAGGHLALWLAARPELPEGSEIRGQNPLSVHVAISQGGLPDLRAGMGRVGHPCGTDAPRLMAGDAFAETSPPEMPIGAARQWMFNNDQDRIAPPEFADAYAQIMARRGIEVQRRVTGGEGHVELIAPGSTSWKQQVDAISQALRLK